MSQITAVSDPVNFLFDVIVTNLQLFKDKIEDPKDLIVNVKFNKIPVNITQSRINVTDFKAGRRTELRSDPGMLRNNLESGGMPIVVRYKGATLGSALITFPPHFIDRIEIGMVDLMHADTCSIIRREQEVGFVELLCCLVIKCDEPVGNIQDEKQKCRNLGKLINPADVMFLVGEPQPCRKPSEPCLDELEPNEGDVQLRLDLERYGSLNQRVNDPPPDTTGLEVCCGLKTMTEQYGHIIDNIIRKVSTMPSPLPDNDCVFTDWSGKRRNYITKQVDRTIPIPVGDWEEMGVKPIRFCPVCLTPMSYLPKYASCPTCCIKPMPQIEEKPEEKLTADQIIQQYLKVPTSPNDDFCENPCKVNSGSEEGERGSEMGNGLGLEKSMSARRKKSGKSMGKEDEQCRKACRCTCTLTKLCVHCRIRKLCADIFKRKGGDVQEECPVVKPVTSTDDFAVIVEEEEEDCRPYLERVFSELRDLYDKRDAEQKELDKRCTQSLLKFGSSRKVDGHDLNNKSSTGLMLKPVGSPTFLHRIALPKIGHKGCLKPHGIVSKRHGWSWPSSKKARKYGWRPGAICRYAGAIMKFFLQYSPDQSPYNTCQRAEELEKEKERRQPILNINKRNGAIFITLRAVNTPNAEMKPIVFKIVKSDLAVAIKHLKRKLKQMGFPKCTCHQTLMMCVCRKNMEKKEIERALQKECHCLGMESCVDQLILTDTSDSELEYNFDISPPVARAKPLLAIKPRTINISTQTNGSESERAVVPQYPVSLSPYWRSYDCAAGDRYTGTAFGAAGEEVFEDGVFGFRGGGPHGESAAAGGRLKSAGIWGAKPGGPMRGGGRDGSGAGYGGGAAGGGGKVGKGGQGGRGFGGFGGKSFPGAKKGPAPKNKPIPVRMPDRHYKAVAAAEKAQKEAVQQEIAKKKKGTNLIKYLEDKGAVPKPWDPNEPQPKVKSNVRTGPVLGEDGLTTAQRQRRALLQMAIPPFETLARLGKGIDPCAATCYQPCTYECCYPCMNYG